jgi:hypothetical protein
VAAVSDVMAAVAIGPTAVAAMAAGVAIDVIDAYRHSECRNTQSRRRQADRART